ncbi:MAG TPA: DUF5906 domain-containing protein [Oculatellaceae cyanobacterium]
MTNIFLAEFQWRKYEPGVAPECVVENPETVLRFNWAFLGRTWLYALNEMDNWQKHLTYIGAGGTGKSAILNTLKHIYKSEDIGVAASHMEATFGLSGIHDKYVWTISEMTKDFKLDYADWLSMVVGEDVLIRQKYKDAFPTRWMSGGMSIGNEPAAWKDKRGAYSRRLIYNRFDYKVSEKDGKLEERCLKELPRIILKMARAYLSLVRWMDESRQTDIEKVWPSMYRLNIIKFQGDNDVLTAFLRSGQIIFGSENDFYVPEQVFLRHFRAFCRTSGVPSQHLNVWGQAVYETAFKDANVRCGDAIEDKR